VCLYRWEVPGGCSGRTRSDPLWAGMSLDGFITGPADNVGNGLGNGGQRLHEWLSDGRGGIGPSGVNGAVFAELMSTGAVVVGRRTFEMAGEWNGDHHGVPIFVLTRRADDTPHWPLVTYVDDVANAMTRAKAAAGEKDVLVHAAKLAQLALGAGGSTSWRSTRSRCCSATAPMPGRPARSARGGHAGMDDARGDDGCHEAGRWG
jgi:dihydrofolate reductase